MQKITPCLWFDGKVEEALKFYTSIFKKGKVRSVSHYGASGPGKKGSILTATFEIAGQEFMLLNGGPHYTLSPAVSFVVNCKDQKDVDYYWKKLLKGGKADQCGWLTDRYGVSWQVVPAVLQKMIMSKHEAKRDRVMKAVLTMVKLDQKALEKAYKG